MTSTSGRFPARMAIAPKLRSPPGISPDISMMLAPVTLAIPGHTPHNQAEDHACPPAGNSAGRLRRRSHLGEIDR